MFNLDKNKKYLLAVSGGADSMAMLNLFKEHDYVFEVAHINYNLRESAIRDENIVKNYCFKHNVKLHLKHYLKKEKGNFQANARRFRYNFFQELIKLNKFYGVVVAHHLDDVIETFLMQKERKIIPDYYGIKDEVQIFKINIFRPLLHLSKQKLLTYCLENKIEYGEDESNYSLKYLRNRIRHNLKNISENDKKEILKEIADLNEELLNIKNYLKPFLSTKSINNDTFTKMKHQDIYLKNKLYLNLSNDYIKEIIRQINSSDKLFLKIGNKFLIKEKNNITIINKIKDYSYVFENKNNLLNYKNKYFKILKKGINLNKFSVDEDDFPLIFRNYHKGDTIKLRGMSKKINRFLIDRKISLENRLKWLVIENSKQEIIFCEGIGASKNHFFKTNDFFVVKL